MVYNFVAKQSAGILIILSFYYYYYYYYYYITYYHIFCREEEKNLSVTDLKTVAIWNSYDKMAHGTGHKLLLTRNRATSHGKINASGVEEIMWKTDGKLCT
jgi:hypothetical protein